MENQEPLGQIKVTYDEDILCSEEERLAYIRNRPKRPDVLFEVFRIGHKVGGCNFNLRSTQEVMLVSELIKNTVKELDDILIKRGYYKKKGKWSFKQP